MPKLFSSRSQEKSDMEASARKPERKLSKREMKSRSLSLPPGAALMTQPSDGFFSKIRKRLRMKSKGKYDINNSAASPAPESSNGSPVSLRSREAGSPISEGSDAVQIRPKSSPIKMSRRSKSDKEEVVLIRKDKRSSTGLKVATRESDGSKEEILVVTVEHDVADGQETESGACASGINIKSESQNNLDDTELDPDYETLDEVRRKVRATICDPVVNGEKTAADEVKNVLVRQPLQVKVKANGDSNGRDSGFDNDSPFTDSPGSSKESQPPASSLLSTSAPPLQTHCVPTLVVVNGAISLSTILNISSDPMVVSSTSLNCSSQVPEEDDLYSNAKVLIRKKSQKQSDSSFSDNEQRSSSLFVDQTGSARNSLTPADLLAIMEAESPDSSAPPPLPVRNYSAEENLDILRLRREGLKRNAADDAEPVVLRSDGANRGAGARPKTFAGTTFTARNITVVEQGPVLTINLPNLESFDLGVNVLSDASPPTGDAQDAATPITPTNIIYEDMPVDNFYEDIPARTGGATAEQTVTLESILLPNLENNEDDLVFIDDDDNLSPVSEAQPENPANEVVTAENETESAGEAVGVTASDLPEDVMIVSASDSMLGNETDDSHSHAGSDKHVIKHSDASALESFVEDPLTPVFASSELCEKADKGDSAAQSENKDPDRPIISQHAHQNVAVPADSSKLCLHLPDLTSLITPTSSASSSPHLSSVSSPSVSSPSACSTDTLNNIAETPDEPDDWEGKNARPPAAEPIHISHKQLLEGLEARAKENEAAENVPPPVPARRPMRRSTRDARSMDLSSTGAASSSDNSHRSSGRHRHHRHSSSSLSPAAQAHKDFLKSMKQLKECGWYWGPLSYEEAEAKLMDKCDGSFLVRDSSNENYILSLSFKSLGQVHHTRIEHHKGLFSFWSQPDSHGKAHICQFIEQTVRNSRNGRFLYFLRPSGPGLPPLPIQLLYPVSRFCRVPSLQHMCRFLVLRCVRRDHIDHLPIPEKVKGYLLEKQYYVETLDED